MAASPYTTILAPTVHTQIDFKMQHFARSAPSVTGLLTLKIGRFKLDHGHEPNADEVEDLRRRLSREESAPPPDPARAHP